VEDIEILKSVDDSVSSPSSGTSSSPGSDKPELEMANMKKIVEDDSRHVLDNRTELDNS
jgi:hypothetical protein